MKSLLNKVFNSTDKQVESKKQEMKNKDKIQKIELKEAQNNLDKVEIERQILKANRKYKAELRKDKTKTITLLLWLFSFLTISMSIAGAPFIINLLEKLENGILGLEEIIPCTVLVLVLISLQIIVVYFEMRKSQIKEEQRHLFNVVWIVQKCVLITSIYFNITFLNNMYHFLDDLSDIKSKVESIMYIALCIALDLSIVIMASYKYNIENDIVVMKKSTKFKNPLRGSLKFIKRLLPFSKDIEKYNKGKSRNYKSNKNINSSVSSSVGDVKSLKDKVEVKENENKVIDFNLSLKNNNNNSYKSDEEVEVEDKENKEVTNNKDNRYKRVATLIPTVQNYIESLNIDKDKLLDISKLQSICKIDKNQWALIRQYFLENGIVKGKRGTYIC